MLFAHYYNFIILPFLYLSCSISWKQHKIPASQLQLCHLLTYEHQILSVVISHSHYSLEHGTGHNISYDLPALEKHILDRFILGKPLIQLEIPQVVYRKDIYTAEAFASIRRNVSPQVCSLISETTLDQLMCWGGLHPYYLHNYFYRNN